VDAHSFDFWLGEWDCAWEGGHGTNAITRELDGRVVVERFEAREPEAFRGMSLSVFDDEVGWRQTWADSNGGYWHLVGSMLPDGSPSFTTPGRVDAERVYKRMVFFDTEPDRFRWRWECSPDGQRWQERWAIRYTRRA
jgi:hypothetical protein